MHTDSSNTGMKLVTLVLYWEQLALLQREMLCHQCFLDLKSHWPKVLKMEKCRILFLLVLLCECMKSEVQFSDFYFKLISL